MKNQEIKFGVNILEHLKKQLEDKELSSESRRDLEGLISHLESGKKYEDYQGKN